MTAREHDPALVEKAQDAHFTAWSFNTAERNGWSDIPAHNLGMTRAVLDAVADDIARAAVADYIRSGGAGGVDVITQCVTAERERVLAEVEALADRWDECGEPAGETLSALVARLRGGEGS